MLPSHNGGYCVVVFRQKIVSNVYLLAKWWKKYNLPRKDASFGVKKYNSHFTLRSNACNKMYDRKY